MPLLTSRLRPAWQRAVGQAVRSSHSAAGGGVRGAGSAAASGGRPSLPRAERPAEGAGGAGGGSQLLAATLGAAGGAMGACAGIGGAVFIVPGLVRFAKLTQPAAAGTSMMAVVGVAATSVAAHSRAGNLDGSSGVNWTVAGLLAAPAAAATPIGATLASRVNPVHLRRALGGFLLLLAPIMPLRGLLMDRARAKSDCVTDQLEDDAPAAASVGVSCASASAEEADLGDSRISPATKVQLASGGVGIGFASGMLGIGGGSLMTPYIALVQPNLPLTVVLGSSFAAMLPPSVVAAIAYYRLGLVQMRLVAPLVGGAIAGSAVGSRAVMQIPEEYLRWGFAAVFFALGRRVIRAPSRVSTT